MVGTATSNKAFFLVFLLAISVRVINLLFSDFSQDAMLLEDAAIYWNMATIGNGLSDVLEYVIFDQTERAPGYIVFLGSIFSLFGEHFLPVVFLQSVLDSSTCLMIMALGRRVYSESFWVFGVIAALWPNFVLHSASILTDTVFMFVFTWFLLSFIWLLEEKRVRLALLVGILLGLATLIRPVTQFMIVLIPVFLPILLAVVGSGLRNAFRLSVVTTLIAASCVAPLILKNLYHYDSLALTSQNGTHLQNWVAAEVVMLRDGVGRSQAIDSLSSKTDQKLNLLSENKRDNPFVLSALQSRTAIDEITGTPFPVVLKSWVQGAVVNLAAPAVMIDKRVRSLPHLSFAADTKGTLIERLQQYATGSSSIYVIVLLIGSGVAVLVSGLQFAGFFVHLNRMPVLASLSILTVTYFILVNGPVGSPKYRLPIEPILIVWLGCALLAIASLFSRLRYFRTMS